MTKTLLPRFSANNTMPKQYAVVLPMQNGEMLYLPDTMQLGHDTSKRETHYKHDGYEYASVGRCSACRWFEIGLYRTPEDYVVWTCGHTIVPGEESRITIQRTDNEFSVVEFLTVRKGANVFLPTPSANVLAQAAKYDSGIQDAYFNRAVP
jgi:hypothetical protein